jgi:hypothetical protein
MRCSVYATSRTFHSVHAKEQEAIELLLLHIEEMRKLMPSVTLEQAGS